ncbi:hypothetical protein [Halogeometricum limi]|uniref:Uncharacterized protein n=1 Tax=Halogeometricum limi TaxID=555875 RepID=A0A1I6G0H4_9EURY|nr:hypothetical protein [Halogeometricum limi]SFR35688.1 hypothetical protein SAMN04488124_0659 [Halogeometricum limi]
MMRRTVLASALTLALPLSGCLGGTGPGDDPETETTTETRTDGGQTLSVESTSLSSLDDCPEVSIASEGDSSVVCRGCVRGKNGCTVAKLGDVSYDADTDELRVLVVTEEERGEDQMCTQALVDLGYEVRVELDGGLPTTVALRHDDVDGEQDVATQSL